MDLEVKHIPEKGRCVFALRDFSAGETIEICPVVVIPNKDCQLLDKSKISYYYFEWGENEGSLALGFGSLYNHSYKPNAEYDHDEPRFCIIFKALKDIKKGEEITVNYNAYPDALDEISFQDGSKPSLHI